jgi:hypothetical protein
MTRIQLPLLAALCTLAVYTSAAPVVTEGRPTTSTESGTQTEPASTGEQSTQTDPPPADTPKANNSPSRGDWASGIAGVTGVTGGAVARKFRRQCMPMIRASTDSQLSFFFFPHAVGVAADKCANDGNCRRTFEGKPTTVDVVKVC